MSDRGEEDIGGKGKVNERPSLIIDLTSSPESGHDSNDEIERTNKARDEDEAPFRATLETENEWKKELRREARKWIGAAIYKRFGDEILCGRVVEYKVENGWFKVRYDDDDEERLSKDEVIQLLGQPNLLKDSFDRLPASSAAHEPKIRKTRICDERRVSKVLLARAINGNFEPNPARTGSSSSSNPEKKHGRPKPRSSYVPLAVSERKRDEYIWPKP